MRENAAPPVDPRPPVTTAHQGHEGVPARPYSLGLRLAGAAVHAYTALGSVLALLVVLAALVVGGAVAGSAAPPRHLAPVGTPGR